MVVGQPIVPVVTSFLLYKGNLLLLRRKATAREFPNRYSGVSGRLEEPHPYLQALKEIEEEIGLGEDQLLCLSQSRPLTVLASAPKKKFKVYPFLFQILGKPALQLNAENESYLFVKPNRLPEQTVPRLQDAFNRVYKGRFPFSQFLAKIKRDKQRSASALLREVAHFLEKVPYKERLCYQIYWKTALFYLRLEMAGFHLLAEYSLSPEQFLKKMDRYNKGAVSRVWNYLKQARISSFTTYSASSLVADLALSIPKQWQRIVCLASYPEREGIVLAKRLQSKELPVEVYPDAAAQQALQQTECLLLGCDALFSDGTLCHKAGTLPLSLLARHLGKKVISIAPKHKHYSESFLPFKQSIAWQRGFDLTPASLLSYPSEEFLFSNVFDGKNS